MCVAAASSVSISRRGVEQIALVRVRVYHLGLLPLESPLMIVPPRNRTWQIRAL
jgi:hypothetical protein